jgi:hypothetical protein
MVPEAAIVVSHMPCIVFMGKHKEKTDYHARGLDGVFYRLNRELTSGMFLSGRADNATNPYSVLQKV